MKQLSQGLDSNSLYNLADSVTGLARLIKMFDLRGLNIIEEIRHHLGYDHPQHQLNEYVILGRWYTDRKGNMMKIVGDFIPADKIPNLPQVISPIRLNQLINQKYPSPEHPISIVSKFGSDIPPTFARCPICSKNWQLVDAHDTVTKTVSHYLRPLGHVGTPLFYLKQLLEQKLGGLCLMESSNMIRHPRFISGQHKSSYEIGWVGQKEGINLTYKLQEGDEVGFSCTYYYHPSCLKRKQQKDQSNQFIELFRLAGFQVLSVLEIPNEYDQQGISPSWFEFQTTQGDIKIGWRKRVINIDWSKTGKNLRFLFDRENVTKNDHSIHAWGYDKVLIYLSLLNQQLPIIGVDRMSPS